MRLIEGWSLKFYRLSVTKQNLVTVSLIIDENKEDFEQNFRSAGKLFEKLGIFVESNKKEFEQIDEIQEEDEDDSDD